MQGCTNPGGQVALATNFCTVASRICWFLLLNLLHVLFWVSFGFLENLCMIPVTHVSAL